MTTDNTYQPPQLVIEAGHTARQYWLDIWRYRELLGFLTWRDVTVRYKQTAMGVAWALVQPLMSMIILTFIFKKLARLDAGVDVPYPLFVYAGTLPWQFFASILNNSSMSLIGNARLITKVYFPRLLVPFSVVGVSLVDFLISFSLFGLLCVWYQFVPSWRIIFLPLFLLWAAAAAMGVGLWLCSLNVKYRDFKFLVPFMLQFGLYLSPVGYNSNLAEKWQTLYSINPMVAVIDGFRWAILGREVEVHIPGIICSVVLVTFFLVTGYWHFRKVERTFADYI